MKKLLPLIIFGISLIIHGSCRPEKDIANNTPSTNYFDTTNYTAGPLGPVGIDTISIITLARVYIDSLDNVTRCYLYNKDNILQQFSRFTPINDSIFCIYFFTADSTLKRQQIYYLDSTGKAKKQEVYINNSLNQTMYYTYDSLNNLIEINPGQNTLEWYDGNMYDAGFFYEYTNLPLKVDLFFIRGISQDNKLTGNNPVNLPSKVGLPYISGNSTSPLYNRSYYYTDSLGYVIKLSNLPTFPDEIPVTESVIYYTYIVE